MGFDALGPSLNSPVPIPEPLHDAAAFDCLGRPPKGDLFGNERLFEDASGRALSFESAPSPESRLFDFEADAKGPFVESRQADAAPDALNLKVRSFELESSVRNELGDRLTAEASGPSLETGMFSGDLTAANVEAGVESSIFGVPVYVGGAVGLATGGGVYVGEGGRYGVSIPFVGNAEIRKDENLWKATIGSEGLNVDLTIGVGRDAVGNAVDWVRDAASDLLR